ncbi:sulfate/molybdate ABC transporter ATP-binding protein [Heliorestis convoluta]|uniref:ABC-type quaternary amine transporter n=1 Tax=Heliorestis convoluta TaxID=356322 RepID=A0A5Q2MWP2_9FIRM|nr:sulfate/molybdate ABC transporter ATP-binding protein [Heliorestis convoluta]QGG46777.1 ABC transporter ATP-binding protein [Heliorestis convoluta]
MIQAHLKKRLPSFSLQLQFQIPQGAVLGLFGPSGCGKSITLRCLAGLVEPDEGSITMDDQVYFDSNKKISIAARKRKVGFLFQNYALFPHLTVEKNITFGLKHLPAQEQKKKAQYMLERMRLQGLEKRYPSQLSGGQQQRVALARTLVTDPALLLLDEPFSALDSQVKNKLEQEVLEVKNAFSGTMILVSHSLEEVYRLCSHIAVMENGRILQFGSRDQIVHGPINRTVARFVGTKNIFDGQILERKDDHAIAYIPAYHCNLKIPKPDFTSNHVSIGIRPSKVRLLTKREYQEKEWDNAFGATVLQNILGPDGQTLFLKIQNCCNDSYPFAGLVRDHSPSGKVSSNNYDLQVQTSKGIDPLVEEIYQEGAQVYLYLPIGEMAIWKRKA